MGKSTSECKCVFVLREDFSSFVWLFPFERAASESATEALISWIATLGTRHWLVTDQGAHLKKNLLQNLEKEFGYQHHFTTPYSPWSNQTVERV